MINPIWLYKCLLIKQLHYIFTSREDHMCMSFAPQCYHVSLLFILFSPQVMFFCIWVPFLNLVSFWPRNIPIARFSDISLLLSSHGMREASLIPWPSVGCLYSERFNHGCVAHNYIVRIPLCLWEFWCSRYGWRNTHTCMYLNINELELVILCRDKQDTN